MIKYRIWLILPFLFSFTEDSPRSQYTIPTGAWSVSGADLDLDGNMDIISGHNYDWQTHWSGLSIMKNTGDGTFYLEDSLYFTGGQTILCGQLDNNPIHEIVFMKWNTTQFIGILYNNDYSDSLFLNTNSDQGINYTALGDVDNNGLTDILFCSNSGQFWGIFYNNGYRDFSPPEYHYLTGYYPNDICCGDLNGDDRDDVVVCGKDIDIFYSFPMGFQDVKILNAQKSMVKIFDFNGDGYADLLSAEDMFLINITGVIIYQNQNDTNLQGLPEIYFQPSSTDFLVNDFNNDELPDIAFLTEFPDTMGTGIIDTTGGIYILYNQGGFQLSEPHFIPMNNYGEGWRNFYSADLDGNGYNDFAVVRTIYIPLAGNLEILFNDGHGNFVGTPLIVDNQVNINHLTSLQCFPNPFSDFTTFKFEIKQTAQVELSVNDLQGGTIQCLIHQKLKGGQYSIQWRGLDKEDKPCKPGIYFVCLKSNGHFDRVFKLIKC